MGESDSQYMKGILMDTQIVTIDTANYDMVAAAMGIQEERTTSQRSNSPYVVCVYGTVLLWVLLKSLAKSVRWKWCPAEPSGLTMALELLSTVKK